PNPTNFHLPFAADLQQTCIRRCASAIVIAVATIAIERKLIGTGAFVLSGGSELPIDSFRIEQEASGRTFLYCPRSIPLSLAAGFERVASFHGQTAAGLPVETHGLSSCTETSEELCFTLLSVEIGQRQPAGVAHELSLTNLHFPSENISA